MNLKKKLSNNLTTLYLLERPKMTYEVLLKFKTGQLC